MSKIKPWSNTTIWPTKLAYTVLLVASMGAVNNSDLSSIGLHGDSQQEQQDMASADFNWHVLIFTGRHLTIVAVQGSNISMFG